MNPSRFENFEPRQNLASAKKDLLSMPRETTEGLHNLQEQPHGIDFRVASVISMETGRPRPVEFSEHTEDGETFYKTHLEAGKEYILALYPHLTQPETELDYDILLFPRSSLLRAGVQGWVEPFTGPINKPRETRAGVLPPKVGPDYKGTRRHGDYTINVLNPNGFEIDGGTPVVQVVFLKKQKLEEGEPQFERRETTHLESVLGFTDKTPYLAKDKARQDLNVTQPLEETNGHYELKANTPYLLKTQERVSLGENEIGMTQGIIGNELANGSALVDAGYSGQLTYLICPKEDLILQKGDEIGSLVRIDVPPTDKTYKGQWK